MNLKTKENIPNQNDNATKSLDKQTNKNVFLPHYNNIYINNIYINYIYDSLKYKIYSDN